MRTGRTSWSRRKATAMILVATAVLLAGYTASTAAGNKKADVTLHVGLFGDFGYTELYKQFTAAHPGVTIKEDITGYGPHHDDLAKHLATGAGAADVEAIDVGFVPQYTAQPQLFNDLRSFGATALKSRWLPWKWAQGVANNGAVVGLGTDVGSLAICYRRDDFKKAGLPTNRAAVTKLWPTWKDYFAVGKRFEAKSPTGVHFFDSGSNVYNAMIGQLNPAYYNASGDVIVSSNKQVKAAWTQVMNQGIKAGESAGLAAFSNDWNTGFKTGIFATVTCPAWMMGYIQGQAPAAKGLWDVAGVPGGGGNWGGSFLTVPKQSKNAALAAELVKFLTSPAAEAFVFKNTGNLPSQPALLKSGPVRAFKNPYFNNAPVGQIFATGALALKPQILGPHVGDIQNAASAAIQRVETGKSSANTSWAQFLKDVVAIG
jgi:cellobiose transport system substrate-binding protein